MAAIDALGAHRLTAPADRGLLHHLFNGRFPLGVLCALTLTAITLLPLVGGFGGVLKLGFPLLALLVAGLLYVRDPFGYLNFTWWIWFVTPLVRRLVDHHVGWTSVSTVMLTPYLVSLVAVPGLLRHIGSLATTHLVALGLTVTGIAYAYVIGAGTVGSAPATFALLTWIVPVLFGFALAANWRQYELWRVATIASFRLGIVLTSVYGIVQFVLLPSWDAYWMQNADMASIGLPVPFAVRVFSTFNAPGVFAIFVMTGLLLGSCHRSKARDLGVLPIVWLGFLLSQVRSAWLGFGVGLIMMMVRMPLGRNLKLLAAAVAVVITTLPLLQIDAIERVAVPRIMSLANGQNDHSLKERMQLYGQFFVVAASNVVGSGIGATNVATKLSNNGKLNQFGVIDSGVLEIMYAFGWPGSILYVAGLLLAFLSTLYGFTRTADEFGLAARSVVVAIFVQLVFFNVLSGAVGMIFWSFTGMIMAGQRFHKAKEKRAGRLAPSPAPLLASARI
ncbi:MAG: O-antigen ligase family protein [Geminicoccaceae bacterium]